MKSVQSPKLRITLFLLVLAATLAVLSRAPLMAADPEDRPSGFGFHAPRIFIGGHMGMNFPRAKSDFFDMTTRELTLERKDFRTEIYGFDFGVPFHANFAAVASFDYGRATKRSEVRDFVEENGDPIVQKTRFSQYSFVGTLRFYPIKIGETVGSYAWVPARVLPYVGAGAGVVHYNLRQYGDFVDTETYNIFTTSMDSRGSGLAKHVAGGMDIAINSRLVINVEARYSWAKPDLAYDFVGFDPIDLDGLKVLGGIYFRF